MSDTYFETLAGSVDGAIRAAYLREVLLARPSEVWSLCQDPLSYGQVRQGDFEIERLKDKPTKKFFHVIITRLDNGRYELVTCVL
jgi:hypothetical protein